MENLKNKTVNKNEKSNNRGASFLSGVLALTISTAVVKIIGVLFKIPILQRVGIEGMAYFLAAYHIYTLLFVISTSGLPVALSILVSGCLSGGRRGDIKKIYNTALAVFLVIGAVGSALMWLFAENIADFIGMNGAALCIKAISPSVFFICAASAVRGYFQGCRIMYPTAISQIAEAAGKLFLGLGLAGYAVKKGYPPEVTAAFAIAGITLGILLAAVYLMIKKIVSGKKYEIALADGTASTEVGVIRGGMNNTVIRNLLAIAVPITLSAAVVSLSGVIDTLVISNRLQSAGYESSVANAMYSSYGNLAIPLFSLVPAFITPLATALVPAVAAETESGKRRGAHKRERERAVISSSFKLCGAVSFPAALGLAVLGRPILSLIFAGNGEAVSVAAPLLSVLSASIWLTGMITVSNAVLQAKKRVSVPIISMIAGTAVKFISAYILIGMPSVNVYGAPVSTFLYSVTVFAVNMLFVAKLVPKKSIELLPQVKAFVASVVSVASALGVYLLSLSHLGEKNACIIAIPTAAAVYFLCVLRGGVLEKDEIFMLPMGEKIYGLLQKTGLIRKNNKKTEINNTNAEENEMFAEAGEKE